MADKKSNEDSPRSPEKLPSPRSVPASPPKHVNLEDIMKWKNGIKDLALAHEIAIDNKFTFEQKLPDSNTLEGQVRDTMHRAFWDRLELTLNEDPPDYSHALVLLLEIKETLLKLLMPHSQSLRQSINEVLDMDLIEQKAEHGVLDFTYYANFIIGMMARMCAPLRDEHVAQLHNVSGTIPLYREIFRVLDLMQLDMANFTIAEMRPYIQQHSVLFEREKFCLLLKTQQEMGIDGLQFTNSWLATGAAIVTEKEKLAGVTMASGSGSQSSTTPSHASSTSTTPSHASTTSSASADHSSTSSLENASGTSSTIAASADADTNVELKNKEAFFDNHRANAILNAAYIDLLESDMDRVIPETLAVDHKRLLDIQSKVGLLTFISTVIAITCGTVGAAIFDLAELKQKLKVQITILTENVSRNDLSGVILSVSEQVIKEVNQCLSEKGKDILSAEKQKMLKGQIMTVVERNNPVFNLTKSRFITFLSSIIANPRKNHDFQIPAGYSVVSDELSQVAGQYLRLITYNQMVYGMFYSHIIQKILLQQEANKTEITPSTSSQ